jgi:hypothetical protein
MRALMIAAVLLGLVFGQAFGGESAPKAAPAGQAILGEGSNWRCFYSWQSPVKRVDNALAVATYGGWFDWSANTPPPPANWVAPDFDDRQWLRWHIGNTRDKAFRYGFSTGPNVALQCLRGRFRVEDPAKAQGMTLSLEYRGGVVVYLNGKEIARGHLPKDGKIEPLTLAEDYPPEAFIKADKNPIQLEFHDPESNPDRVERRIRKLEAIAIKPEDLRKGVNVLAIELHRTPDFGTGLDKQTLSHQAAWNTAGLVDLDLLAEAGAEPNIARPTGIQVWNASVLDRSSPYDYADPCEPLGPVIIPAMRNGSFTGKVIVSSGSALRGVKAECADLVGADGNGKIPAAAVSIRYTVRDDITLCRWRVGPGGLWDSLVATPPAEQKPYEKGGGAMQPILIKVKVPADAAAGEYQGKLTINAEGSKPVEALVRVRVADWQLPDSKDWTGGHLAFVQSPDTLALYYKVPQWSEEHWRLIEESLKLMGEMGNRYVWIPLICRTNFGNEQSMVRWVRKEVSGVNVQVSGNEKKDGAAVPDTRNLTPDTCSRDYAVFDRYLDLVQKYMKPDVVCLYIWDRYTGESMKGGKDVILGPTLVTRLDPATGKLEDMEVPTLGTPEAKALWVPVCKEIRDRLEKRGLLAATMMGLNGDYYTPTQSIANMIPELMPGMKWVSNSHEDMRGRAVCKVLPVGYNTLVYAKTIRPPTALTWDEKRDVGWRLTNKVDIFPRGAITCVYLNAATALGAWRLTVEMVSFNNSSGIGRSGFDFWPVPGTNTYAKQGIHNVKRSLTICARYPPSWDQLNMDVACENLVAPGPNGPLPTERFENLREGMQEMEARVFIEKAVITPALRAKLGEDLAKKCQRLLDERHWRLRATFYTQNSYELADTEQSREELFSLVAEVAGKLGTK